jgi:hyperosmotically inducible periplasmic protein
MLTTKNFLFGSAIAVLAVTYLASPAESIDLNPLSMIKGAVEAIAEDRSSGDIGKDLAIKTEITAKVIEKMGTDVISLSADVYEQNVMLTGAVKTKEQKIQAEKLTREVENIKKIFNEILIVKPIDKDKGAVENFVDDTVIESKANALLLDAGGVNVTNFRWRSVGGHVFLFGRALSKAEKDKSTKIVKEIKNVLSVKNLALVRAK